MSRRRSETPPLPDEEEEEEQIPHDRWGPLNVWNGNRNNINNPGGPLSLFNQDGTPRRGDEEEEEQIVMREILPRRYATRSSGINIEGIELHGECEGKKCPITQSPITGYSIKLDADNKCYDATAISTWYKNGNTTSPLTRQEFSDRDKQIMNNWIELNQLGGRKKRKPRKTRKTKKTRKTRKTRKSRKKYL
jgi:hypothetical protein